MLKLCCFSSVAPHELWKQLLNNYSKYVDLLPAFSKLPAVLLKYHLPDSAELGYIHAFFRDLP